MIFAGVSLFPIRFPPANFCSDFRKSERRAYARHSSGTLCNLCGEVEDEGGTLGQEMTNEGQFLRRIGAEAIRKQPRFATFSLSLFNPRPGLARSRLEFKGDGERGTLGKHHTLWLRGFVRHSRR